jgi:cytochrome c oxidase assembly protein subunit 15
MAHRLSLTTAAATLFLLFVGGLVTTTNSGDSVPDWWFLPLSFGKLLPPMVGEVFYEHGHRLVAASVGLLTIAVSLALWRTDARPWVRKLGVAAVALVCAQGILGGLRVHHVWDPRGIAIVHACTAQAFFGLVVALATFTSRAWRTDPPEFAPSPLPHLAFLAAAATYVQIILGAVRRHTGWGTTVHMTFAFVAAVLILVAVAESLKRGRCRRTATALAALLVLQIALGFWTWAIVRGGFVRSIESPRSHMAAVTLHLAVGGLVYALSLVLALRAYGAGRGGEASSPAPVPAGAAS